MKKISIGIVGLGGVGGFYGGLLARQYEHSETVEINFIVRGSNYDKIKDAGLTVRSKGEEFTTRPKHLVKRLGEIGVLDYIIIATKAYDLQELIHSLAANIHDKTVIVPLINGVEAYAELKQNLNCIVMQGCTYMVSRLLEPGVIDNPSGRQKIFFGVNGELSPSGDVLQELMQAAGINADNVSNINQRVWEKYVLVSASASATTFFNCSIGEVMTQHTTVIHSLVKEAVEIARSHEKSVVENLVEEVMSKLSAMPADATTSMHSDFLAGKEQAELEVMTGYMVKEGKRLQIATPTYIKVYEDLKKRRGINYLR